MKRVFCCLILIFSVFSFAFAQNMVDINSAPLEELDKLTGIGQTYAQRIIDGRPYSSLDDLLNIKGIGPATLEKIKTQGLACVSCAAPAGAAPAAPAVVYPGGIFLNEILPSPKGADETDEYIKLYNSNDFETDLNGWVLQDKAGTVTNFEIKNKKIPAKGFLIFYRPETKIMLNNDGDGLNFLSPDGKVVDSVDFSKAPAGQPYAKTNSGWQWAGGTEVLPKTEKSAKNNIIKAENLSASLNQAGSEKSLPRFNGTNPWFLFFITLAVATISAICVLIIKFKFKTNVRT